MSYHVPVLAKATVEALVHDPNGTYVDVTFGGGGHSQLILDQLGPEGRLIAFDQDPDAEEQAKRINDDRLLFVAANFRHIGRYLRLHRITQIDGLLADLGVSSHQFDVPERGFSYRYDAPLDMRMSQDDSVPTAAQLLQKIDAEELQWILGTYGEVRNARTVAQAIVAERTTRSFKTTGDLLGFLDGYIRGLRPRYLSQVFQALRIAVNDEMGALEEMLTAAQDVMRPGGKLVVMSYHSGEDRLVKHMMKTGKPDGQHDADDFGRIRRPWKVETRKPVEADEDETRDNPRARSARLRIAMRNDETKKQ
ncbi:MAG: 16S rRNA (cytosine(1402)-N(4))-methyltransferase RsmH [Saprospiraceae bacterium]